MDIEVFESFLRGSFLSQISSYNYSQVYINIVEWYFVLSESDYRYMLEKFTNVNRDLARGFSASSKGLNCKIKLDKFKEFDKFVTQANIKVEVDKSSSFNERILFIKIVNKG